MERSLVADFYRGKGYLVHESIVVTGQSGNQQRVPLLCEGPMGNLAVFFGDAAGVDGQEIGAAKRVARDLGATAVVAAPTFTSEQRRAALEMGVVLLDDDAMVPEAPQVASAWPGQTRSERLDRDLEAHPWPASGRVGGKDGAGAKLLDIDDVLATGPKVPAPDAMPERPTLPGSAAVGIPKPAATPSAEAGLWKHARSSTTPAPQPGVQATAPTTGRFAWLDLPKPTPPAAEVEYTGSVAARAAKPAMPAPIPLTPEELAAQRQERMLRQAQLRVLVRRGSWVLGTAVGVYLFLLWWL